MKTTLEIPDDLFREAKARAVMEGLKLKDFVAEALAVRLSAPSGKAARKPGRVTFPLVRSRKPGSLHLTGAMIAEHETGLHGGA